MKPAGAKLLFFLLCNCLAFTCLAQSTVLKVNPLPLPLATLNAAVEHKLNQGISLQLSGYLTKFRFKEADYSGWALTPEMRFYIYPPTAQPRGWYLAPFARYSQINISREPSQEQTGLDGKAHFLGGGAVVGYQWLLGEKNNFSVDVFAGPRYSKAVRVSGSAQIRDYEAGFIIGNGFWIRSGITLGWAF